jgi:hypothetical protein
VDSLPTKTSQDATTVRILRRGVGIVGILLPIVLTLGSLAWGHGVPGSMSGTYYTEMRDFFVGGMWAVGVFLICYRCGWPDDLLGPITGGLAILVAVLPATPDSEVTEVSTTERVIGYLHYGSASVFFVLLAVFCFALFTRISPTKGATPQKLVRNRIYRICGGVIIAAGLLALVSNFLPESVRDAVKPLLICEALAVFAFGAAWLVKGETVFKDSQTDPGPAVDPESAAAA